LRGQRPLPAGYPREPKTLGEHLRKWRLDRGLRQRDVADTLGVQEQAVTLWERNRRKPRLKSLAKLHELIGTEPPDLGGSVGQRLRSQRIRLGWTQEDLARKLGVSQKLLRSWEKRNVDPWGQNRVAVEKFLSGMTI
jgi:transcriptional regulator with XRE-family HTH domain